MENKVKKNMVLHPKSGKEMTGADIIVQVIADENISTIFGYSGGAILPTYDAVFRYNSDKKNNKMPLVVPANEQGASFMASGYSRSSGNVGVAIVTSGPGATNCVTAVRDCMADSIPIIVICGQVATSAIGTDAFQEAPVSSIMGAVAKHVYLVTNPKLLEDTVRSAFKIARTGRPGPVLIDIPKDIQNWKGKFKGKGLLSMPGYESRIKKIDSNSIDKEDCKRFFDILQKSKRPLIYAGGGVINSNSSKELTDFAISHKIPVVTTLMGIGCFDTKHELAMHMLGMHGTAYANYAIDDCDLLIAFGARFDDRVAGDAKKFAENAKNIIHFDVDPSEIHKVKMANWHYIGPLKKGIKQINEYSLSNSINTNFSTWHEETKSSKKKYALNYNKKSESVQPYYVIEEINKITKGQAIITTGVGQHQMWAAQYFDFCKPRLWLTSGSMGTMGFGLPAAIGAQFACPDKLVIDLDGDASIRMNIGEMETLTSYNLPIKVIVLNNFGDGMVMQWQRMFFKGRLSGSDKSLRKKNFVKSAIADGFKYAKTLDKNSEVKKTLKEFLSFKGPAFLEVIIDPEASVYPMVPPGLSYKEIVTGDFIPNRYIKNKKSSPNESEMF